MSSLHIFIHIVFGLKSRRPVLEETQRPLLFEHIVSNAKAHNIDIQQINGHIDNVHVLVKLNPTQSLSQIMQIIKGESSWWANKEILFEKKLIWSKGYYARSIDPENVWMIKKYINGQKKHEQMFSYIGSYMNIVQNEDLKNKRSK